jgi:hypothetical protein
MIIDYWQLTNDKGYRYGEDGDQDEGNRTTGNLWYLRFFLISALIGVHLRLII